MSKALNFVLALAAAAGRAQADAGGGLVVSALFGTEPPQYVHAAITNVLSFTLPTTKIVGGAAAAGLRAAHVRGRADINLSSTTRPRRLRHRGDVAPIASISVQVRGQKPLRPRAHP